MKIFEGKSVRNSNMNIPVLSKNGEPLWRTSIIKKKEQEKQIKKKIGKLEFNLRQFQRNWMRLFYEVRQVNQNQPKAILVSWNVKNSRLDVNLLWFFKGKAISVLKVQRSGAEIKAHERS